MARMALTHSIKYSEKLAKAKGRRPPAASQSEVATGGKLAALDDPIPAVDPLAALMPAFLLQVDGHTLDWLEKERRRLGFRSRSEVIRKILTEARGVK